MIVAEPATAAYADGAHADQQPSAQPSGAAVAGGAADVDADDDAAVCSALFRGLVFFLGCASCSDAAHGAIWGLVGFTQMHVHELEPRADMLENQCY